MGPFYVLGGVLAAWALIVTALGVTRPSFPGSRAAERGVAAISVVLVAAAISSAIIGGANEAESHGGEEAASEGHGNVPAGEDEAAPAPAEEAPAPAEAPPAEPAPAEGEILTLAAEEGGDLAFDKQSLEAQAGLVQITMDNPSPVPHNVALEGSGVDEEGEVVTEGEVSEVSAELSAGEYTFFCSVPGHREAGMEGTLTVR